MLLMHWNTFQVVVLDLFFSAEISSLTIRIRDSCKRVMCSLLPLTWDEQAERFHQLISASRDLRRRKSATSYYLHCSLAIYFGPSNRKKSCAHDGYARRVGMICFYGFKETLAG